jgi:hypothetical protein
MRGLTLLVTAGAMRALAGCGEGATQPGEDAVGEASSDGGEAQDAAQPGGDTGQAGEDAAQTGLDAAQAGGDTGQTGEDAAQPGLDAAQTGGDTALSGADTGGGGGPVTPGRGFDDRPIRWRVPPSGLDDGLFAANQVAGPRGWATLDLDGDGAVDLVRTADPADDSGRVWRDGAGSFWWVHYGADGGFEAAGARWAVPDSGLSDGFFSAFYGYDARWWYTVDLDGDRRPELVQTADPARPGGFVRTDGAGGYWRVWRSGPGGFTGAPVRWSVPASGLGDGFFAPWMGLDARHWALVDTDGDGRLDLVQTADPSRAGGQVWRDAEGPHWRVWRGAASGFDGDYQRLGVPDAGTPDGFFAAQYASVAPGTRFWALLDLDGDRRAELLQTADPARAGGQVWRGAAGPFWRVHALGAGGFGAGREVPVGDSGLPDGFFAASYASSPALGGERFWTSLDLDGDGRIELVQTGDPEQPGGFVFNDRDGPFWRVWRIGHDVTPARWSVPSSGLLDGFFAAFWTDAPTGSRAWFVGDVDGDGRLDLVQTADPGFDGLRVPTDAQGAYWLVFRGR